MKPLVSVIIPVYNTEKQLPRCIESILAQQMRSIEIILIDDGTTDRSGAICDMFAEKDERVKVFHTSYQGVAAARNVGLQKSSGEYIMFVDSDDWVPADFCEAAYRCAVENKADMVIFGFRRISRHILFGEQHRSVGMNVKGGHKTREEAIDLLFHKTGHYCWNKLCRRFLYQDISFPAGRLYEDVGTVYRLAWNAGNIHYLPKMLYCYCSRSGSISTVRTAQARTDWIAMHAQVLRDLAAWGFPPEKLDLYCLGCAMSFCIKFGRGEAEGDISFLVNRLLQYKTIPARFSWKRKVLFVLLKYFPPLFDLICGLWGKR